MNRTLRFVLPACIVLCAGCLLHTQRGYYLDFARQAHARGSDDAYISFRYAWNLAQHGTLAWNESGFRRTEGFTNPAWVYISAVTALAGRKDLMYPLMAGVSVFLLLILLIVHYHVAAQWTGERAAALAALLAAASPPLWVHATSGIESAVFGACVSLLAVVIVTGSGIHRPWLLVLTASCVLLRSDGVVFVAPVVATAFLLRHPSRRPLLLGALLSFGLLLLWRQCAFGPSLFPTTAVAKLNIPLAERAGSGLRLLCTVLFGKGFWFVLAAAGAGLLLHPLRVRLAACLVCAAWIGYYVFIGGDSFLERHLVALFLFCAVLSAPFWQRAVAACRRRGAASGRWKRTLAGTLMLLLIPLALFQPLLMRDGRFSYHRQKRADPWITLGTAMRADRSRYGTVICAPAGKIPFFAGGDFVDPIGLNDEDMARIRMRRFQPGHSSGSVAAAQALLRRQHRAFTTFTFIPFPLDGENTSTPIADPVCVLLCISFSEPETIHTAVTDALWKRMTDGSDTWCAIVRQHP